jgi:hypothetical protein
MQMVKYIGGIVIALVIFVGFGGTFKEMASNSEYGYPTNTSTAFNTVYMTNGSKFVGDTGVIAYNFQQKVDSSKYKDNVFNFMSTAIRLVTSTVWDGFVFVKNMLSMVINTLGIPPIVFGAIITVIVIALAVYVAKAIFGREL